MSDDIDKKTEEPAAEQSVSEEVSSEEPTSNQGVDKEQESAVWNNVKKQSIWLRLFFMLVISFLYGISRVVTGAVVIIQFFWVLFTGEVNENIQQFGQRLATYTYQIIRYLTFNTEERPFPFDLEWPQD